MKELYHRLCNLLKIPSILTLACTIVFVVLCLNGIVTGEQFLNIFLMIVSFYFGSKVGQDRKE